MEKRETVGNPNGFSHINQSTNVPKIGTLGKDENKTDYVLAKQIGVTHNTVINASKFTEAVDKIVRATGIQVNP